MTTYEYSRYEVVWEDPDGNVNPWDSLPRREWAQEVLAEGVRLRAARWGIRRTDFTEVIHGVEWQEEKDPPGGMDSEHDVLYDLKRSEGKRQ